MTTAPVPGPRWRRPLAGGGSLALAATAVVLASVALAGCGSPAGQGSPRDGAGNGARPRGLSRQDRKVVARTALTIMARLAEVRAEVRAGQLGGAADDLRETQGLTGLIAAAAPTFNLRERVRIARTHLSFEDGEEVVHELVPIERELHELAWMLPIQDAEEHLRLARDALTSGHREVASSNLQAVADAVLFQEIDLPLQEVDSDIVAARQALQLRRLDEVDGLLERAESSLDVLTVWARWEDAAGRTDAATGSRDE